MIVKQHINHEAIQKICHLHNGIFRSINLSQFYSVTSRDKLSNEGKEDFLYT